MQEPASPEITLDQKAIVYPSLTERIKSSFIDLIFILFISSMAAMLFDELENVPDWVRACLFIGLLFIYEPIAQTFGCTLGNYIMQIRARKISDTNTKINIAQAYVRFAVKSLLGWVSFFTINSNRNRRAIHDMASGSVMVYAD